MKDLRGTGVALTTPMKMDYSVDFHSLEKLINHAINGGVDYLVVLGTTGESPVFSWKEKIEILEFVFTVNTGRKPIIFGHGGNHTFDLIEKSKDLKDFDLTAILSASPYYSKPSQKGITRHYQMLADASHHPIILYNVPSRTASNVKAKTTIELANHENIIAVKEASGDLDLCKEIATNRPTGFMLLSGDDSLAYDIIKMGGEGVISVIGNVLPAEFTRMINTALNGDLETANQMNQDLQVAYKMLSEEGNPASLKAGLEAYGIGKRTVKPPLFEASDQLTEKWAAYFKGSLT